MGYQMPIVVKEVYLPLFNGSASLATLSKEEYKKLTGIDLDDIFVYEPKVNGAVVRPFIKLNGVNMDFTYTPAAEGYGFVLPLSNNVVNNSAESIFCFGYVKEDNAMGCKIVSDATTHEILSIKHYEI